MTTRHRFSFTFFGLLGDLPVVPILFALLCAAFAKASTDQPQPDTQSATQSAAQPAASPVVLPPTSLPTLPPTPREFRAMWVASVANIDWPSKKNLTSAQQQAEMNLILDTALKANFNAIILQIRPSCDALYESQLEPWSEFLTDQSGRSPGYDPLSLWIRESHRRGLELHAWFNPFRARHFKAEKPDAPSHVSKRRPEWVRKYDNLLWLDPGVEEARAHSMEVILDVVSRYDIDGVHFDDYFYPYPKDGVPFPDDQPFNEYQQSGGKLNRSDWRRDNINRFVEELYKNVKAIKPFVQVGISPFGIWRPGNPPGVQGFDAYEGLSADARLWLQQGWMDYCSPQLYWPIDSKQPYGPLLDWWLAQNPKRRHVFVGNYTSRIESTKPGSTPPKVTWGPAEIVDQIDVTRKSVRSGWGSYGNIHFSAIALLENRQGILDLLREGPYAIKALPPAFEWNAQGAPPPPTPEFSIATESGGEVLITIAKSTDETSPSRWVIWGLYGSEWKLAIAGGEFTTIPLRAQSQSGPLRAVGIRSVDRTGRESPATVKSLPKPPPR